MWVHRPACLPYSISFHWSTPLRRPPQCRCQTHSPLKPTNVEPGYGKDQVTLAQMSDPPRLTRPARTPSTVRAPPLSPYRFTISLMESFEILTFSSLDSCLSRCRLHKACPHCRWVRFPPHLPRNQLDQRSEPRCFMLNFVLVLALILFLRRANHMHLKFNRSNLQRSA